MGEPVLKASDVPTKLPANNNQAVVKSRLDVDGLSWNVTCVSMGNPHCVTFSNDSSQVFLLCVLFTGLPFSKFRLDSNI